MLTRAFLSRRTARIMLAIPLLFVLISCGSGSPSAGMTPTPQKTKKSVPTQVPQAMDKVIDFNVANIHIHSNFGSICVNYPLLYSYGPNALTANLVLATNRLTYDSAELQQMRTYARALSSGHPTTISSTLKLVQGTKAGDFPIPTNFLGAGCFGEIELTNLGKDVIQIQAVDMRITAVPQKTSRYQYRMIDICSLVGNDGCPPGAGGAVPAIYGFRLKAAPIGTTLTANNEGQGGPDLGLNPNDSSILPIIYYFISQDPLTYSLTPELTISTANAALQTIPLPQLAATLIFADPNLFSCYNLRGDTFVQYKGPDNNFQFCI